MPELRARPVEFRRVNEVGPETEGKMLALWADGVYFVGNGLHALELVQTHSFTQEAEQMYSLREKAACSDKGGGELFECQREYATLMAESLGALKVTNIPTARASDRRHSGPGDAPDEPSDLPLSGTSPLSLSPQDLGDEAKVPARKVEEFVTKLARSLRLRTDAPYALAVLPGEIPRAKRSEGHVFRASEIFVSEWAAPGGTTTARYLQETAAAAFKLLEVPTRALGGDAVYVWVQDMLRLQAPGLRCSPAPPPPSSFYALSVCNRRQLSHVRAAVGTTPCSWRCRQACPPNCRTTSFESSRPRLK